MRNIWTIAKREYDNYFNSPLAYVVAFMHPAHHWAFIFA